MGSQRQSGLESLSIGFLLVGFGVALLIGWWSGRWWLVIPVFMIEGGVFYIVVRAFTSLSEAGTPRQRRDAVYYAFWERLLIRSSRLL